MHNPCNKPRRRKTEKEEMVDDLISIIHVFSSKIYGLKKYKTKKDLLPGGAK